MTSRVANFSNLISLFLAFVLLFAGCGNSGSGQSNLESTAAMAESSVPETSEDLPEWKRAYADYFQTQKDFDLKDFESYLMFYLDDDEIPELFLTGAYNAAGNILITQGSDHEIDICMFGNPCASECMYEPGSGKLFENFMHRDSGCLNLYEVIDGTIYISEIGIGGYTADGEDDFYLAGEQVSRKAYYNEWTNYLDKSKTIKIDITDEETIKSRSDLMYEWK